MGEIEGQDRGGGGRPGSVYMLDKRGARKELSVQVDHIRSGLNTFARHICRRHRSRRSWWLLSEAETTGVV